MTQEQKEQRRDQNMRSLELYRDLGQDEMFLQYFDRTCEELREWFWYESLDEVQRQFGSHADTIRVADVSADTKISDWVANNPIKIRK